MAADLVRRRVAVILGNTASTRAAMAATATVPIVFVTGNDPVRLGIVASISRPGGNVTGIQLLNSELQGKQVQLIRETLPRARRVTALINPTSETDTGYFRLAQAALGLGQIGQFHVGVVGGGELLAVEFTHVVHHVLVHGLVAEQHLKVAGLEPFEVGAGLDGGAAWPHEVVDLLLLGAHAGDVIGE